MNELNCFKIVGRLSVDLINKSGFKISALDIEKEILAHPYIEDEFCEGENRALGVCTCDHIEVNLICHFFFCSVFGFESLFSFCILYEK